MFEAASLLDDYGGYVSLFEEEYHRLRDERLSFANARRLARAEEAHFLGNALRAAVYRSGLGDPTVTARIDAAMDWTSEELRGARFERSSMSAFAVHRLASSVMANAATELDEMGGDDDSGADMGL